MSSDDLTQGSWDDFQEPDIDMEPVVGPVIVTRQFLLNFATETLTGVVHSQPVLDALNVAQCSFDSDHEAPVAGCTCGFYGYDVEDRVWTDPLHPTFGAFDAVVELSGKVIVCERGLKAQRMRILGVASVAGSELPPATRSIFATNYPRVRVFKTRDAMLEEFPLTRLTSDVPSPVQQSRKKQVGAFLNRALPFLQIAAICVAVLLLLLPFGMAAFVWFVIGFASSMAVRSRMGAIGHGLFLAFLILPQTTLLKYSMFIGIPRDQGWGGLSRSGFLGQHVPAEHYDAVSWAVSIAFTAFFLTVTARQARLAADLLQYLNMKTAALPWAQFQNSSGSSLLRAKVHGEDYILPEGSFIETAHKDKEDGESPNG